NSASSQGVVTYTIIVDVQNPDEVLKPGMTAQTRIVVASKPDVTRLPTAALRFRPDEDQLKAAGAGRSAASAGADAKARADDVGTPVLHGIDLAVHRGDHLALMGPSGSGKSTLMNLLGLLDRADAGRYRLAGRDVTALTASQHAEVRNKTIGFVFQSFNLLKR